MNNKLHQRASTSKHSTHWVLNSDKILIFKHDHLPHLFFFFWTTVKNTFKRVCIWRVNIVQQVKKTTIRNTCTTGDTLLFLHWLLNLFQLSHKLLSLFVSRSRLQHLHDGLFCIKRRNESIRPDATMMLRWQTSR